MRHVYLFSGLLGAASAALDGLCPPLGPVLPAPKAPSANAYLQSQISLLNETLHNMTAPLSSSAISFAIQSIHEHKPMLEFHYTPKDFGKNGVQKVDANTVYRLASTSKLFPVLAVLKTDGMELNDPITKYLPQLRNLKKESRQQNQMWVVDWDDITLGALSSHLGAPADCMLRLPEDPRKLADLRI